MIPDQRGLTDDVSPEVEADGFYTLHCTDVIAIVDEQEDDGPDCGA